MLSAQQFGLSWIVITTFDSYQNITVHITKLQYAMCHEEPLGLWALWCLLLYILLATNNIISALTGEVIHPQNIMIINAARQCCVRPPQTHSLNN